ncbi:hypothetical protein Gotri_005628, partial [Gossypium trilobum]|nr:hypothetical protein [Gossypium trilobum]
YRKSTRVGIIGAGISGIAAAKQLSHHNPIVFEATDSIGGVWKHCSFASTKLQTPPCDFEFSDYPWPQRDNSTFPSYLDILHYLHAYATHFDVLKFVRFNSRVVEIRYIGGGDGRETTNLDVAAGPGEFGPILSGHPVWEVAVETHPPKTIERYGFELLVVCIGKYGDIPKMPVFPPNKGQEVYGGKVMHTLDYSKLDKEAARELLKGKKVAVVGYKKSAIDLATECAQANQVSPSKAKPGAAQEFAFPSFVSCGYIESVSNLQTAELRCKWLSRLADGLFKLPSIKKMLDQTSEEIEIMKKTTRFYKRHCISTFSINHSDEICEEMGWKCWRKNNWVLEAFAPYSSQDYGEED